MGKPKKSIIEVQGAAITILAKEHGDCTSLTDMVRNFDSRTILGQGGMGVVWLARDERLEELVALKFLPPQIRFDVAALAALRRETLRSRKLSHPGIFSPTLYHCRGKVDFDELAIAVVK
jgi:serine/threonine protein kinase